MLKRRSGIAIAAAVALAMVAGFGLGQLTRGEAQAQGTAPFGFSKVVFLSHVVSEDMPIWPGDPHPRIKTLFTVPRDGFRLNLMRIGEHSGTHWGAPCHFNLGEPCADQLDPQDFFHPAVVIDVRAQTKADPDFRLRVSDVQAFEADHGQIPPDGMVIMWTGFQERWDRPKAYHNFGPDGLMHFPGFSANVTNWLIANRAIGGLGIDTLGVDPGTDEHYRCNTNLLHEHRIHLENLAGLDQLPPTGGWVVVGGTRNEGGSGSPATVFGLVP
jgi:kynurenine formamidase